MNKLFVETLDIDYPIGFDIIIIWYVDRYSFLDGGPGNDTIHI